MRIAATRSAVLAGAMLALLAPAAAAHETGASTAAEHFEEDYVVHSPGEERRLGRESRQATRADAAAAEADAAGDPEDVGEWGPLIQWPLVGIHIALMPDGDVLAYDSVGDRRTEFYAEHITTRAISWDPTAPANESVTQVDAAELGVNIFCSGLAHLADGSLFIAGGNKNNLLDGSDVTGIFDGVGDTWTRTGDMAYERWYPSVTPLQTGEMLITEGIARQDSTEPIPAEMRGLDGSISTIPGSTYPWRLALYPWMDAGPDGQVWYTGPDRYLRSLGPDENGAWSWRDRGTRDNIDRDYGSRALFDIGKVIVSGGGGSPSQPPTDTAAVVDLSSGEFPGTDFTGEMAEPRRQHNLTVLPDGTVLATGGLSTGFQHVDIANGVYTAEVWDPDTGNWTELAAEDRTRQYHSTALLLPDGRVLSSGGGICGSCEDNPDPTDAIPGAQEAYLEKNAQVFSPPYLFAADGSPADRPEVTGAPEGINYAEQFAIDTPDAASVEKVSLVRLGAVTHSVNMEQRYVPLDFARRDGGLTAIGPADANVAPPGVYMLFVVDGEGVPSIAEMVQVRLPDPQRPPLEPPADTTAPDTWIERGPKRSSSKRKVRFRFASDDAAARFECSLDARPFAPCSSPRKIRVKRGRHRFRVRAIDAAGNADSNPASARFRVTKPRRGR